MSRFEETYVTCAVRAFTVAVYVLYGYPVICKRSLVPGPFQPHLQHANMEEEGLGDVVTCGDVR